MIQNKKSFSAATIAFLCFIAVISVDVYSFVKASLDISTMPDDSRNFPVVLLRFLDLASQVNPWILAAITLAVLGWYFWLIYQIFKFTDEARKIHKALADYPPNMIIIQSEFRTFTERFDDIVKYATNHAAQAIRNQNETFNLSPEINRLSKEKDDLLLKEGAEPENGWDEWTKRALSFQNDFDKLQNIISRDLINEIEWRQMAQHQPDFNRFDGAKKNYGDSNGAAYWTFLRKADTFSNLKRMLDRKLEFAEAGNPLINPHIINANGA